MQIPFICHLVKLCSMLGAKVFKLLWRVIFGVFLAEDEQRRKLVSAHPQISLWFEKSLMMWNSDFCKIFFSLCHSDILNCVMWTKTDIQRSFQCLKKYLTLFLIITIFFFLQIKKLNFDSCWCFYMSYYPTFVITQNVHTDLTYMFVWFK